jgi:cobalamin biosynthesis protein CbiD
MRALLAAGAPSDPAVHDAVRRQIDEAVAPWVRHGEYVTIEVDMVTGLASVKRCSR